MPSDQPAASGGAEVDHVVLTRFSVLIRGQTQLMPDEWLRYRLGFFYDTAYPSLTRQRDAAPFTWLVFCDERCPDDVRATIEDLAVGAFTPVWTRQPFRDVHQQAVADVTSGAPLLATTRVDSDDAVAVDFLARIQAQVHRVGERQRLFVDLPRGLQVDRSGAVYAGHIASSPFLSLVERRELGRLPDTVFAVRHPNARTFAPMLVVSAPPMWLQVIHGANVRNIVNGARVDPGVIAQRFDIDLDYRRAVSRRELWRERIAHRLHLTRLWAQHPGQILMAGEAAYRQMRGTHEVPMTRMGGGWAEQLKPLARRLGYRPNQP